MSEKKKRAKKTSDTKIALDPSASYGSSAGGIQV
jgi:hypothetical protein